MLLKLAFFTPANGLALRARLPFGPSHPTKTKLQNPLLRARVEGIDLDMREVVMRTLHLEGMQGPAGLVLMRSPSEPLDPILQGRPPRLGSPDSTHSVSCAGEL